MGRHLKNQEVQEFRMLTERLSRGRRAIRHEFIPELVSWLVMKAEQYTRTRIAAANEFSDGTEQYMERVIKDCKRYEDVIQQLINMVGDPFGGTRWESVTTRMGELFGIKIGEPIPANLDVAARTMALPQEE